MVVPSAGAGTRLGQPVPKQFCLLSGEPLIVHPLRVFRALPWVGRIIVVHGPDQKETLAGILEDFGLVDCLTVEGGATRQESVRRGLASVTTPKVIVHNAAVALVTSATIEQVIAIDADCVTTTTAVETNLVRGGDVAEAIVSRAGLKVINSPQCFRTAVLRDCHARAFADGLAFASETELMLHFGITVRLVPGPFRNFKITTAHDLMVAEAILGSDRVVAAHPC